MNVYAIYKASECKGIGGFRFLLLTNSINFDANLENHSFDKCILPWEIMV